MTSDTRRTQATLLRESFSRHFMAVSFAEEKRRRKQLINDMSNCAVEMEVVAYYTLMMMRLCDAELRAAPLFNERTTDPAGVSFADSRMFFGFSKTFADRELQILNKMSELDDEQNRYGFLSDKQNETQSILCESLIRVQKFTQIERQLCDFDQQLETLVNDESMRDFLQALFFLVLTHSHTLREVVCVKINRIRLKTHEAFCHSRASVLNFFDGLVQLTKRYVAFELGERKYVEAVRALFRTGAIFETNTRNK